MVYARRVYDARKKYAVLPIDAGDKEAIVRLRRKTRVAGAFLLWPQTVQAIQWALNRRRNLTDADPQGPLLLNEKGKPYDEPTAGDNAASGAASGKLCWRWIAIASESGSC
jgi:hypothetical protein